MDFTILAFCHPYCLEGKCNMHLSEIWHSKKNDSRLSRTQVTIQATSAGVFALVAANIIASAYFSKKYTEATYYLEEAKKARAKAKLGWKVMEAINQRAMELESVMKKLGDKIEDELLYLEPLVYDFQSEDEYYLEAFSKTSVLVKALSEVAQVPLIDKKGELSNESSVTIVNTQKILNKNL